MENKTLISFLQEIKKIKKQDIVYSGISFVFVGIIITIFSMSAQYISKNINKVFYSEDGAEVQALNIKQYELVTKKLGIASNLPQEDVISNATQTPSSQASGEVVTNASSTPSTVATETTITLDKTSINIIVKNSTSKKGLATELANSLESDGFKRPKTGNEATSYSTTTLIISEDKQMYSEILLESLRKKYTNAIATTTKNIMDSDAIIIIGAR